MRFDFADFFRSVGVPIRTEGKNVKAGWINICCPLCGDDKGFHLGCNPATGFWACWRDSSHRNRSPARLIRILTGCSWERAREISGEEELKPGLETWAQLGASIKAFDQPVTDTTKILKYPPEFRKITDRYPMQMFWNYLAKRHFREEDIPDLCHYYRLRGCVEGDWNRRLIIPLITEKGMEGWQGRVIGSSSELRYLTEPDSSIAKRLLMGQGKATKGYQALVVVEGPIDYLKIDYYAKVEGIRAVCTMGTAFTPRQVSLILKLSEQYGRLVILFDPGAQREAYALSRQLSMTSPIIANVPSHREDPGDLRPKEVLPLILKYLKN